MTMPWGGWTESMLRTAPPEGAGRAAVLTLMKVGLGITAVWIRSSWNFTPQPGDRYFLLVPNNGAREGSYGLDSNGAERPASASACMPQRIAACP